MFPLDADAERAEGGGGVNCRITKTKGVSRNKVTEFFMTSIAYVLHEHGFEGEKVLKILKDIEDVADSMVDDYIAFNDIRKVLKDEYDFEIRMKG